MSFSPPKKTKNIPDGAQWLGGIGAGSWFFLSKKSTYYQIKRFSAYGNLECKGLFVVDDNSFRIEEGFEFCLIFLLLSEFALSVSSFFVSIMELSISGSTNLIY